jgi:hypothetical protein
MIYDFYVPMAIYHTTDSVAGPHIAYSYINIIKAHQYLRHQHHDVLTLRIF